ncbi:MAG: TrkA family potassium uptake protein [Candidatus Babeliaceae bacterium]|nr:TrkA family potassium uptake protein [Candidatus Babeliaceae bacterium]
MKQFAVIGLGNFGFNLGVSLAKKGHEVLVIDSDSERVEEIKDFVTSAIVYDVRTGVFLNEYIKPDIDAVILNLGETIEANSLAIYHLKEIGVKNIIVKSVSDLQSKIYQKIGATHIINPEQLAGENLAEQLSSPSLIDYIPLAPEYGIFEIAVPDKFLGKSIKEIDFRKKYRIEIIAIKNVLKDEIDFMPDPGKKIEPDSILLFICKKDDFSKLGF